MTHYDVAIIGAGMSGLAAGIRLAHFGKRVCIFERHSVWGGLNSFYKKGGHHFDVGLHAMTNWLEPGYKGPRIPLQRVYRQLRLDPTDFALEKQTYSQIQFGETRLRFDNGLELLKAEVQSVFGAEVDGFERLARDLEGYPEANTDKPFVSTRAKIRDYVAEPLLAEMLLAPLLWYGSAHEDDVDWEQFQILFNSIYREGFCRPHKGVKQIIFTLVRRYEEAGGLMRRKVGVKRLSIEGGRVVGLVLDSGEKITADAVLSSAGLVETERLRDDREPDASADRAGQIAFTETIHVLDAPMRSLGFDACITFFNDDETFDWHSPEDRLVDTRSSVICVPDNFGHELPLEDYRIRVTHLAHKSRWFELDAASYAAEKDRTNAESYASTARVTGEFASHIRYTDSFTPRTVAKYTGHINGAIYGSPHKRKTGRTDLDNLFIMGTDQGMLGIVGAMLSGVAVANQL